MLYITVEDDGRGIEDECLERFQRGEDMEEGKKDRKHIGISNVRDRIRHLYGESYGMEITKRDGKGTMVLLRLPVVKQDL